MSCSMFLLISLLFSSGLTHPFAYDDESTQDKPCLHISNNFIHECSSILLSGNVGNGIYGLTDLLNKKQIISEKAHLKLNNPDSEQGFLLLLGREKANLGSAMYTALAIIAVALIPKGLMIYIVWRKSRTRQMNESKTTHSVLQTDTYFEEIRDLVKKNDPKFLIRFMEVYPDFTSRILQKHSKLLNSELFLCAMIFLNFSSKEIATYTFIQHRSVQTKKSRLRKKMQLSSSSDLYTYIRSFA